MGTRKTGLLVGGTTLLERALAASAGYARIVVVAPWSAGDAPPETGAALVVINEAPERGMAHSLRLANAAVADRDVAIAVLLADTPLVDAALVSCVIAARGVRDIAYPVRGGVPGHPVVFGPAPRAFIDALPDGDTLRALRADPRWSRVEVEIDDERPFLDIDTPADLEHARRAVAAMGHPPPASK